MKHEIFEANPNLKEVHATSDGQCFYNDNDAKMHAKTLKDKSVELIVNPSLIDVEIEEEELDNEVDTESEADEKAKKEQEAAEQAKAELVKSLADFDPETVKYPEALKLFKALGLEAENEKKDTIYPLLVAAKASAQEGVNTEE